jgi:WD40 repeat protein
MANLERMKTVFCHADFNTNEVSSIFNVAFDKSGKFIISGADDGVLKVWDRDSLTL